MKKTITLFILLISIFAFSQETIFTMNDKSFTDFVVIQKEGKLANELYSKTIEWISRTYKNPESVILAKIENEYIRFEGIKSPFACRRILGKHQCEDGRYQVEISFKDNRYKFDIIKIELYEEYNGFGSYGWSEFNMNDTSFYYKNGKIRNMYKSFPESFERNINEINESLSNYISGKTEKPNDNW